MINFVMIQFLMTKYSHLSFLGHRLERDVETGGLQTRHTKREADFKRGCHDRGLDALSNNMPITPTSSEGPTPTVSASASAGKTTFV
jgi:hypothetical protein